MGSEWWRWWSNSFLSKPGLLLSIVFIVCSIFNSLQSQKTHWQPIRKCIPAVSIWVFSSFFPAFVSWERLAQTHTSFGRARNLSLQIIPKGDAAFNVIVEGESISCLSRSTQKILHYKFIALLWKISPLMWIEGTGILSNFIVGRHLCLGQTSWAGLHWGFPPQSVAL